MMRPGASTEPTCLRLVLFGEQRSGTTLLADLLDAQVGLRVASGYLGAMMYCAYRELGLSPASPLSPRKRHVLWQRIRASERDPRLQLEATMPAHVGTLDELHVELLARIAQPQDRIVGHKIHGPIEALPALLERPDARCIYMIRDVRDVLLSRSYRGQDALDEPTKAWLKSAKAVRALGSHPRLLVVRFEDLLTSTEATLSRIADWLGLASLSAAGLVDASGRPKLQNSSHGELAMFDSRAVGRFREHRGSRLMRFAQWRCRDELQRWGYALDSTLDAPLAERRQFVRRLLVIEALELPRRAKNALLAHALPSLVADD